MFEGWDFGGILSLFAISLLGLWGVPVVLRTARKEHRTGKFGSGAFHLLVAIGFTLLLLFLWIDALTGVDLRDYVGIHHV